MSFQSILREDRRFAPNPTFQQNAHIQSEATYQAMYRQSIEQPENFWREQAQKLIPWQRPFSKVLEWQEPFARWFSDGQTNASVVCVEQHLHNGRRNKAAILWEGEPGDVQTLTYAQLHGEVCRLANVLTELGLKKGERVAIYMPMVPEAAIAMLACARLGAPHNVVFGGFSAEALRERIQDAGCSLVITADGGYRRGAIVPLKHAVDEALKDCPTVRNVLVFERTKQKIAMLAGRDHSWQALMAQSSAQHVAEPMDAEHPLFVLYTSGSTGKPKGILHTTAGYLVGTTLTSRYVFDLRDDDIYWCTADVGWITGHSYLVYGPLSNGATVFMYEGAPNQPDFGRFWQMIERHRINIFYTAPTAIRAFIRAGDDFPKRHDLSSLRLLGSVGEPINPEAWMWYHQTIGQGRCPIVDTWWQTETGAIMITPLPGVSTTTPGSATRPFFGVDVDVVREDGSSCGVNEGGLLVIKQPWPSMLRTIYGNEERYRAGYWQRVPHCYLAGDSARRDEDGNFWIMGRIDDVLNVSGHRLGTAEIESALVQHPDVAEAAVVGRPDDLKGQAIVAFVTLKNTAKPEPKLREALRSYVGERIGALAKPDDVRFAEALPKTRSGKIMRRLLKEIAGGNTPSGDTTTLEDFTVLAKLQAEE